MSAKEKKITRNKAITLHFTRSLLQSKLCKIKQTKNNNKRGKSEQIEAERGPCGLLNLAEAECVPCSSVYFSNRTAGPRLCYDVVLG